MELQGKIILTPTQAATAPRGESMSESLQTLHGDIAARTFRILEVAPDWPCRRGCDSCCRSLAAEPLLTAAEWQVIDSALSQLPESTHRLINSQIGGLDSAARPLTCPFLDHDRGECFVYDARPAACRTYGFYVERDRGLYCRLIEGRAGRGEFDDVVWGNHESIEVRLDALGPRRALTEWMSGHSR